MDIRDLVPQIYLICFFGVLHHNFSGVFFEQRSSFRYRYLGLENIEFEKLTVITSYRIKRIGIQ